MKASRVRTPFRALPGRASAILLSAGTILVVLGARLRIVERYGSDLPWWDQWGAEAEQVLTPWYQHGRLWRNLLVSYSEHRIAPTRALNLALTAIGGQWDARVECCANALLAAALAAVLLGWVRRHFGRFWGLTSTALVVLFLSLPLAAENILGGFQSQFLFLIGFSTAAIYGLAERDAGSAPWLMGLVAGLLAMVSMGSGFFFSIPVAIICAARLLGAGRRRDDGITLGAAVAFAAVGWWSRPLAPWQGVLHAGGARDFLLYFAHCLAWPKPDWPWLGALVWLPWTVMAAGSLRSRLGREEPARNLVFAGGLWVLLQIVAVSYARGARGEAPATRYAEVFTLGVLFSYLSIPRAAAALRWRAPVAVGAAWAAAVAGVALYQSGRIYRGTLPDTKADYSACERNIQGYLLTNDPAYLSKKPVHEIPFFAGEPLARVLAQPEIRKIMPAGVRPPVPLEAGGWLAGFHEGGVGPLTPPLAPRRAWGSFGSKGDGGPAFWESALIPASAFAFWRIDVAGALGMPGTSLQVISGRTGAVIADIRSGGDAGGAWRAAYVRAPREPARVVARSDSPSTWFAFGAPVEMSWLSYWSMQLTGQGTHLLAAGLALAAAAIAGLVIPRGREG
jgi:hypothetical protein